MCNYLIFYCLQHETPLLGDTVDSEKKSNYKAFYQSVTYMQQTYKIGDCAYFNPDAFNFPLIPLNKKDKPSKNKDVCCVNYRISLT